MVDFTICSTAGSASYLTLIDVLREHSSARSLRIVPQGGGGGRGWRAQGARGVGVPQVHGLDSAHGWGRVSNVH